MTLTIVGLGPGDPQLLTRQAWDILNGSKIVYLRTRVHPTVEHLPHHLEWRSFDDLYEQASEFSEVYDAIVDRMVTLAASGDVVYAVPGDPLIGEGTVTRLIAVCRVKNVAVRIVHGVSFVEPSLGALGVDGTDGIQLLDAIELAVAHHPMINPDRGALVAQIYSQQIASDVKLTLMNQYPDSHKVTLIHAAGTPAQRLDEVPLYEMDRHTLTHLTSLYIPPVDREQVTSFEGFQETIAHLRAPEGCPWDREQTHLSLRSYLIEEAYEVLDAIDAGDPDRIREELGDLLLQIVLHAQIAVDEGEFTMADVIGQIDTKIRRRHPHVWGNVDVQGDPERVAANWEVIKAHERAEKGEEHKSVLDGVPKSLPALAQANEYDRRASRVGFDWPNQQGVVDKVREELAEVLAAATPDDKTRELGDLLLAVAVLGRWMKIAAEDALRAACQRFYQRFTAVERLAKERKKAINDMGPEELDALWLEAKRLADGH